LKLVLDVEENWRRGWCCWIVAQLSLRPFVEAVEYECERLATAFDSCAEDCLDSGSLVVSLGVYIVTQCQCLRQR